MTQIHIDRLHIRARGISAEVARSALDGLAMQILRELDGRPELAGRSGRVSIGRLAPAAVTARRGAGVAELRDGLAHAAVDAIASSDARAARATSAPVGARGPKEREE